MSSTVYLSDYQSLLSRFTQGIAGRYLHLKSTDVLTGSFRPAGGTTDGFAIYLPESVDAFPTHRENLGIYRVTILHQVGYYEFGTFEFSLATAQQRLVKLNPSSIAGSQQLRRHDDQPVDLEQFFDRFHYPDLARRLFLLLEDHRIDARLILPFPGIEADLARVKAWALAAQAKESVDRSMINQLLHLLLRYSLGADSETLIRADNTGIAAQLLGSMRSLNDWTTDVYDTAAATINCYELMTALATNQRRDFDHEDTDNRSDSLANADSLPLISEGDLLINGADFRGEVIPELVQRRLRMAEVIERIEQIESLGEDLSPSELAQQLDPLREGLIREEIDNASTNHVPERVTGGAPDSAVTRPSGAEAIARLVREELDQQRLRARRDESVLRRAFGDLPVVTRSYFHDEWDYVDQRYRKGWCRLHEERLRGDNYDYFPHVRQRHRLLAAEIESQLRRIRAESLARVVGVTDGDEFDLDRLIGAVIDRRAGWNPDERIYSRKERARRDVAAAFLLDMSASTDDSIPDPDQEEIDLQAPVRPANASTTNILTHDWSAPESTRRVIDVEKEALVLMSEALSVLGDAYAIYGFSGYSREEVEFYVAKEFDDALDARSKAALADMKPKRSTRMGPAIRHATQKLHGQDAPLKVMIILSDGFPQDCDYGPDRNDHEYGIQDTAKAIEEAENRNIVTFCITVDQSGHDYLRRMCSEDHYLVINDIESLPNELSKIYQRLTV